MLLLEGLLGSRRRKAMAGIESEARPSKVRIGMSQVSKGWRRLGSAAGVSCSIPQ